MVITMAFALLIMTLAVGPMVAAIMFYRAEVSRMNGLISGLQRSLKFNEDALDGARRVIRESKEEAKVAKQTLVRVNNVLDDQAAEIESKGEELKEMEQKYLCEYDRANRYEATLIGLMDSTHSVCLDALDDESDSVPEG